MMIRFIYLCLLVYLIHALQDAQYLQTSKGGQFSFKNNPPVLEVQYLYSVDESPYVEVDAVLQENGNWLAIIDGLKPKENLIFYAAVLTNTGLKLTTKTEWTPASIMPLPPRRMRGAVIFRDDFNGNKVDQKHWSIEVTATGDWHNQFQVYTNDARNVFVRNGKLFLKPTLTIDSGHFTENDLWHGVMDVQKTWGWCTDSGYNGCYRDSKNELLPPICSGRIESLPTLKYGTVTVRAKVPRGDWLWPAIWLMPRKMTYGLWPRSGEIDLMEVAGNEVMTWKNGQKVGIQRTTASIFVGPDIPHKYHQLGQLFKTQGDWHDFHDFKVDWSPNHIILYVDNQVITRLDIPDGSDVWKHYKFQGTNPWTKGNKIAPFDQEFYLILNVAVGGTGMFSDTDTDFAYPKPWKNDGKTAVADFWKARNHWLPTWHGDDVALIVDYVEFRHQ